MSSPRRPIITLLTDFGTADPYVGICKGVILGRCPDAQIVDLTHEVPQGNVHTAGFLLGGAWRYFPAGTVHVAVVDPGVGTGRRIVAADVGGQRVLAPDNGLLSAVLDAHAPDGAVHVTNADYFLDDVSRTFHGRDVFAPVAAALASGVALSKLGEATKSWIHLPALEPTREDDGRTVGEVVYVDRFGNLVTNLTGADVAERNGELRVTVAGRVIRGVDPTYGAAPEGALLALIGSTGRLEISVNRGDAAGMLGVGIGTEVTLSSDGGDA